MINVGRAGRKISIRNIAVVASRYVIVQWLEESRIVMRTSWFVPSVNRTVQATAVFSMMPNETVEVCHTWAISSSQGQKRVRGEDLIEGSIPYAKAFTL